MFSEKELAYLRSQRLARIATVSASGEPDVAAVAFKFDGRRFFVGGIDNTHTIKYTNTKATGRAALVVDDYPSASPPQPRGIKIHGKSRLVETDGYAGPGEYIEITPERYWSWGIEAPAIDHGRPMIKKVRL
jgi:pyridoxamine 5'-phosphate oxidase family protein